MENQDKDLPSKPARKPRVRDPGLHRAKIMEAAAASFAENGYARATLRDIAQRAGVTHGLIKLHFGSKEALFLQVVPGTRDWADLVRDRGRGSMAENIAEAFSSRTEKGSAQDLMVALIRASAGGAISPAQLYEATRQTSLALYMPLLGGEDAEIRTEFIMAFMIGVTFSRFMAGAGLMQTLPEPEFKAHLAKALSDLLADAQAMRPVKEKAENTVTE